MSFQEIGYRENTLVRLDIKINGEDAPPLATVSAIYKSIHTLATIVTYLFPLQIVHKDKAYDIGKAVCNKLKELIPRQQFKVSFVDCSNIIVFIIIFFIL